MLRSQLQGNQVTPHPKDNKLSYWENALNGLSNLHLQTDLVGTENTKQVSLNLEDNITSNLKEKFKIYTIDEIFLTSLYALLYRYSSQFDICIGIKNNNSHLPLRITIPITANFTELLPIVSSSMKQARENELPLLDIINAQPKYIFPFNISFALNKDKPIQKKKQTGFSNLFYFDIQIIELHNDKYQIQVELNTNLFKHNSIQHFLTKWQQLLNNILLEPDCKILDIGLLNAEEKKLIDQFNATDRPPAFPGTVADYFHDIALEKADKTAVVFHHDNKLEKITYGDLNKDSTQLANYFTKNHINQHDDSLVMGICLSRSISLITGMIAAFKSGFPLVMLETEESNPLENKLKNHTFGYILVDNITQSLFSHMPHLPLLNIQDDKILAEISQQDPHYQSTAKPDDTIYINYTSGTTGTPKGVMIHQAGLANLLNWLIHYQFSQKLQQTVPDFTTFKVFTPTANTFDAFFHDCLVPWAAEGGELHMCPDAMRFNPDVISAINKEEKINFCVFLPSLLSQMPTDAEALQFITSMGDMPNASTMKALIEQTGRTVFNGYGPTEITIIFSIHPYQIGQDAAVIGKPVDNMKIYILNPDNLSICPPNIPGEIYITGIGVAKGYFNRPDLTEKAFPYLKFQEHNYSFINVTSSTANAMKFYATGDYAVYQLNNNNQLEVKFLGRKDRQLKIHGVRVELEGIETALRNHPDIMEAAVMPITLPNGEHTLTVYVVCKETNTNLDNKALLQNIQHYLRTHSAVPRIHFPSSVTTLEKMPLNKNGKIDKTRLPAPTKPNITSPKTTIEYKLQELWARAVGYAQDYIDIKTGFTALGGFSLSWKALIINIKKCLIELLKTEYKIAGLSEIQEKEYEEIWPKNWDNITIHESAKVLERFILKCQNDARKMTKGSNTSLVNIPGYKPGMYHNRNNQHSNTNNQSTYKKVNK